MKNKTLWKSLKKGLKSHGDYKWKVGEWRKVEGTVNACHNGFHASNSIIDAMNFVDMECLALVEVRGASDISKDKEAWEDMKIVKAWKWEKEDSVALSIFAAELVIEIFEKKYPDDKRLREAIEAAKTWLKSPTEKNRNAAYAANAAANAAYAAAYAAANAAAYAAAYAAAREKILKQCHDWIVKRTKKLTPIK